MLRPFAPRKPLALGDAARIVQAFCKKNTQYIQAQFDEQKKKKKTNLATMKQNTKINTKLLTEAWSKAASYCSVRLKYPLASHRCESASKADKKSKS